MFVEVCSVLASRLCPRFVFTDGVSIGRIRILACSTRKFRSHKLLADDVVANVFRCIQASSWPSLAIAPDIDPASACVFDEGDTHAPQLPSSAGGAGGSSSRISVCVHCNLWAHSRTDFVRYPSVLCCFFCVPCARTNVTASICQVAPTRNFFE